MVPLPPSRQRHGRVWVRAPSPFAYDGGPRRLVVAEIQFAFVEADLPVEHHLQRASARQHGVRTARNQYPDHARRRTCRGADPRAHAVVPTRGARDGSDAGTRRTRLANRSRIAGLIAFAARLAFGDRKGVAESLR